ncbi:lipopolysaccharide biosynthesis protein [Lutibacter flavus]|uniref:Membrane protein involved in the export of O-antigen and teichoic acid n=1 Tax=Lutibacter flavus TaxID=691689 RepID=A0A238VS71_9FLAO|nr:oligosaccharide flippase family protein [Lutibacter flavus]SNR36997.1 Membrane protein involved in the export of O-antigen and teichoic acid [Lutibacter flavus]
MNFLNNISKNKDKLRLFGISGLNQSISSATNFLIGLYLVKEFSPTDFGIYGIGFAIILFIGGTGNALLLTQMVVIYPSKKEEERDSLVINTLYLTFAFCMLSCLIALLLLLGNTTFNNFMSVSNELVLMVVFASAMYLLKEFFVRTAYNNRKENIAVYIHSSIFITVVMLFALEKLLIGELSNTITFLIYGIAHLIGIIFGFSLLKLKVETLSFTYLTQVFKELWKGGKWGSITNVVYTLRSQAHTIIATILIGPVGVGNLNAARLFITPAVMVIPVISQLAIPRLATLREVNKKSLINKGGLLTKIYLVFGVTYSIVLLLSYNTIISGFLNDSYQDLYVLTMYWCLYAVMLAFRNGKDIIAQVLQKFKQLTIVNIISSLITLLGCYVFAKYFGLKGNIIGLIFGEVVLIIMLHFLLRNEGRNLNN